MYTALYMASTRTQVYLKSEQRAALDELRAREGKTLAEVVREAIDAYLERAGPSVEQALERTRGALPDLQVPSREEWAERERRIWRG